MRPWVFVSYAREDRERIAPFVRALQAKERPFEVFVDTGLTPGSEWDPAIRQRLDEAAAVICFVSQDWEAKDYCQRERRRAIERYDADRRSVTHRRPQILPVHLRPVVVPSSPGGQSVFRFSSPWDAKVALTEALRDTAAWERAAVELVQAVEQALQHEEKVATPPAEPAVRTGRIAIEVPQTRALGREVRRTRIDLQVTRVGGTLSWYARDQSNGVDVGRWSGMLPSRLLDERWRQEVMNGKLTTADLGGFLGNALLDHAPTTWCTDARDGAAAALRVLLITEDPVLASLPWRWARDGDEWLVARGWTFELLVEPPPHGSHETLEPVVRPWLLLPRCAGMAGREVSLGGVLGAHFDPGDGVYPELMCSRDDLRRQEHLPPPRLVVVATRVEPGPMFALDMGAGETLLPSGPWLRRLQRDDRRDGAGLLLWLTVDGVHPPTPELRRGAAVTVTNTLPLTAEEAERAAQAVLYALTFHKLDPARAVEQACKEVPGLATACLAVHSRVAEWTTSRLHGPKPDHSEVLRLLDRETQRTAAYEHVYSVVGDQVRARILVLIGVAGVDRVRDSDRVGDVDIDEPNVLLPAKLESTIYKHVQDRLQAQAEFTPFPLLFPLDPDPEGYPDAIRRRLRPAAGQSEEARLHELAKPAPEARRRVLWFDAGVVCEGCDGESHQHRVDLPRLRAWAQAVQDVFGTRLPDDLRVVCWLTVVSAAPAATVEALREVSLTPRGAAHAMVEVLDPIDHVNVRQIRKFLHEKLSGFDGDPDAAAHEIFHAAGRGRFAPTVRLLEQHMRDRWAKFHRHR